MVIDGDPGSYGTEDEFELALSAAGSVAVRAIQDEQQASIIASDEGRRRRQTSSRSSTGLTRAEFGEQADLATLTGGRAAHGAGHEHRHPDHRVGPAVRDDAPSGRLPAAGDRHRGPAHRSQTPTRA